MSLRAMAILGLMAASTSAMAADPILEERFAGPKLGDGWTAEAAPGNTVEIKDGALVITAAENTYAHIQRPLDQDLVRVTCEIQPGSGISWATSLFLYWDAGDWVQIGVIPRGGGRLYACITTAGGREEHDLAKVRGNRHPVGLELGEDCIRFLGKPAGKEWESVLVIERPARLAGAPKLLIVGKGFGVDANSPTLNGSYGEPGTAATSQVREIRVEHTPADRLHITATERRAREMALRDPIGTEILELPGDPTFEAVATRLPALAPREAVGVPEHPHEIAVLADGTLEPTHDKANAWVPGSMHQAWFEVAGARFGTGGCRKRLLPGGVPAVIAEWQHDGLVCTQTVFGWSELFSPDAPLSAWVSLVIFNDSPQPRKVPVALHCKPAASGEGFAHEVTVPADGRTNVCLRFGVPLGNAPVTQVPADEFKTRLDEYAGRWAWLLDSGMQVRTPEPRVNDAWRAWLAYNALDVDKKGEAYEPHDGSGFYEEVYGYSAVLYCHALDLWGYPDAAERYIKTMLGMRKPDGMFYINYGLPDHGGLIWAMCEHYRLTGRQEWLAANAVELIRMGDWILDARAKALAEPGRDRLTRGLIKFRPYADYPEPTFSYYGDVYSCLALESLGQVLEAAGRRDDAKRFKQAGAAYRADILASMDAATFEHGGRKLLPMEPDTRRHLKGQNYVTGGYYGLVASMLLEAEVLPPEDPRAMLIVRGLENGGGLIAGASEFAEGIDHAYTYGYWLNCLRRGDAERVLLGFYTTLACGMGRETYCGVEVTQIMTGEPTPTMPHLYSGTQQLRLLRNMLVLEEGDGLVLNAAAPRDWLKPGAKWEIRRAPTLFGELNATTEVADDGRAATVRLELPTRTPPKALRVWLRHPSAKPPTSVKVNGAEVQVGDTESVMVDDPPSHVTIEARWGRGSRQ